MRRVLPFVTFVLVASLSCGRRPITSSTAPRLIEPFPLRDVRLLPGPLFDAQERNRRYLYEVDVDRLLHMFRVNAGLPSSSAPLGEWESPDIEIRGHTLGHYLSACALAWAGTRDDELRRRADRIVSELAECQKALGTGYGYGYVSAFPEELFDRLEAGEQVWAPWYTMHKIMAGLLDVHMLCGNEQALHVLLGVADWVKRRTDRLSPESMQKTLETEFGGMNEVLYNLYAVTGDVKHLDLARRFNHARVLDGLMEEQDHLKGLHANTTIPKVVGFAREFEQTGNQDYQTASEYFWRQVATARSYVTGGTSNYEHWRTDPFVLDTEVSVASHESCCTYNMLKLTKSLFTWTGEAQYADFYERALFNAVLPTQNPADGSLMYFVPMVSGMWKMFMKPWHSFLCCNGTGIESFSKLQDGIFFHDEDGIYVNLFVASELTWKTKGIRLRQTTEFPVESAATLTMECETPVELSLHIRVPGWVREGAVVRLNGEPVKAPPKPGSYLTMRRTWSDGDQVTVEMPMGLRLEKLLGDEKRAAILYGPLVLAGELGIEGMTESMIRGFKEPETNLMWLRQVKSLFHGAAIEPPVLVTEADEPGAWIRPMEGRPLTFETVGVGRPTDVTLVPFYRLFGQRYGIYWEILNEEEWTARQSASRHPEGRVDEVRFGDASAERVHNFQAFELDRGRVEATDWVESASWLQIDLDSLPDAPMGLHCRYVTDEPSVFDVLVDGQFLASERFSGAPTNAPIEKEYSIPAEMTRGKRRITVMFEARREGSTGRLVGCSLSVRSRSHP